MSIPTVAQTRQAEKQAAEAKRLAEQAEKDALAARQREYVEDLRSQYLAEWPEIIEQAIANEIAKPIHKIEVDGTRLPIKLAWIVLDNQNTTAWRVEAAKKAANDLLATVQEKGYLARVGIDHGTFQGSDESPVQQDITIGLRVGW
jgi:hypothetical protein